MDEYSGGYIARDLLRDFVIFHAFGIWTVWNPLNKKIPALMKDERGFFMDSVAASCCRLLSSCIDDANGSVIRAQSCNDFFNLVITLRSLVLHWCDRLLHFHLV